MMSTEITQVSDIRVVLETLIEKGLGRLISLVPSGDVRNELTAANIALMQAREHLRFALLGKPLVESSMFTHDEQMLRQLVMQLDGRAHWFMHSDPVMQEQIIDLMKSYAMQMLRRYK